MIITKRLLIQRVHNRWTSAYPKGTTLLTKPTKSSDQIADELARLDTDTATPEQVAAIIGNISWTDLKCGQCNADVEAVMDISAHYSDKVNYICHPCLKKAALEFETAFPGGDK